MTPADASNNAGRTRRRSGGGGGGGGRGSGGRPPKKPAVTPDDFWGDPDLIPDTAQTVRVTHAPAAVIQSLGRPPFPGHEVPAEHTLKLVYEYAVSLGEALATAGELIEADEDREDATS